MNRNMNKMFDNDIFASDDKHEDNNVPNYGIFNKHVFDIYQQVETIEFAYPIVIVSKWVTLNHQHPTIDKLLKWRKKWFQNKYLENPIEDINEDNHLDRDKERRRNLNDDNPSFYHTKKLKINKLDESIYERKLGDDDIEVVKVVPSLVIGKIIQ